jgi:predicted heme/steroid binding protein
MPGKRTQILFTKEVLKKYSDTSSGLYLAILGKVYDVGKGEKFYGPEGSYHFFTGM